MNVVLTEEEIVRAVDIQKRGYELLRWMEKALDDGFISPGAAERYASREEAAIAWLDEHFLNIPANARPLDRKNLAAFSNFFSTYLQSTFELDPNPGKRPYSPDAHCFCPMCSWMVNRPHLRPKKVSASDKKTAERLKHDFLKSLVAKSGAIVSDEDIDGLLANPDLREAIGLCAYVSDVLSRTKGVARGAASLALWRSFAWTREGSPRHGFQLQPENVTKAQERLLMLLSGVAVR